MTQQHPITPPSELVRQWLEELYGGPVSVISPFDQRVLIAVAQWGADQELEECIDWMKRMGYWGDDGKAIPALRAARRPEPPNPVEKALRALDRVPGPGADPAYLRSWADREAASLVDTIRLALEQLDD
jgi:hypothetical protein